MLGLNLVELGSNMKIGFLEESEGVRSATRLIFVIGSFWAMVLCSYLAINGLVWTAILSLFSGIIGVLGGIKLGQRAMEDKPTESKPS